MSGSVPFGLFTLTLERMGCMRSPDPEECDIKARGFDVCMWYRLTDGRISGPAEVPELPPADPIEYYLMGEICEHLEISEGDYYDEVDEVIDEGHWPPA